MSTQTHTELVSENRSSFLPTGLLLAGLVLLFIAERVIGEGMIRNALVGVASAAMIGGFLVRVQWFKASQGEVRQVERLMFFAYVGVMVALGFYVLSQDWGIRLLGQRPTTDMGDRLQTIFKVLWPAILSCSLLSALAMEVPYLRMPLAESVELRRVKIAGRSALTMALAAIFLFSINYVTHKRDIKKDLSYLKTTRPSESTQKLVQKLGTPVHVVLFFPRVSDVLEQVRPYFDEVKKANKTLKVDVWDHAMVPKFARDHRVSGNGHVLLIKGNDLGPNAQTERFEIGNDIEAARPKLKTLDQTFQERLTKLTKPPRSIALTVGHGERNAGQREGLGEGDGVTSLREVLNRLNIRTSDLGMAQGLASKVPEGTGAVAIIGPREPLVKEEAETLLNYVQNGGRVVIAVDPDVNDGLEPLLTGLGLQRLPGVLASETQFMRRNHSDADKTVVYANEYTSHPSVTTATRHSREVASIFVEGGALAEKAGAKPAPSVTFPLRTAPGFWRDLNGNYKKDADEPAEALNMMAAVTFPGQGGKQEGRAIVIADSDFVSDKLIRNPGNLLPFIDSLRWLVGEEDISGAPSSEEDVAIEHTRAEDKWLFYLTTFGAPVPIALAGLWVSRRRKRRTRISKPAEEKKS